MLKNTNLCLVSLLVLTTAATAEDWPQFRGAQGNAVAAGKTAAVRISESNTKWSTGIGGTGWSSPVVSGDRIWLTTAETFAPTPEQEARKKEGDRMAGMKTVAGRVRLRAVSVNAETGKLLHYRMVHEVTDPELIHTLNSYASPTPAISGDYVVCHFGSYGTWCVDRNSGETVWKNDGIVVEHSVGPGSSPVIEDGVVLLVFDGTDKQFIVGLDVRTGKEIWRTARPPIRATDGEYRKAYSTPLIITVGGRKQAVIPGAQWMCAYDPATGKEIWRADTGRGFSTTPMAVYESGFVVCSTGFMAPTMVAIDPKGTGDVTESHIAWKSRNGGSTMPTAVAHEGRVYCIDSKGILTVLEAKTGTMLSRQRVNGKFCSSPLIVGDKLYIGDQDGRFRVYELGDSPKELAENKLGGAIMASPAMIGSDMLIRTSKALIRVTPE